MPWSNNESAGAVSLSKLGYWEPGLCLCFHAMLLSEKFNQEEISNTKDYRRHPPLVTKARAQQIIALLSDASLLRDLETRRT